MNYSFSGNNIKLVTCFPRRGAQRRIWIFTNIIFRFFQLLGGACFSHGPYTFYKAVRIGNGRVLRLGSFFLTKLWSDADLVSIGELQLLWMDSRGPNQPLASLRLYFLPENTPDGRRDTHGEVSFSLCFQYPKVYAQV